MAEELTVRTGDFTQSFITVENYGNVVYDDQEMPASGWLTSIGVRVGGDNAPTHGKLALWDSESRDLLFASPELEWSPGASMRRASGFAVRRRRGQEMAIGFWRDADEPSVFGAGWLSSLFGIFFGPARGIRVFTHTADRNVPRLSGGDHLAGTLSLEYTYVRQERPLAPTFLDPTPEEGGIANLATSLMVTLPHGADADYDFSTAVQITLVRRDTNTQFYNQIHEVSSSDTTFSLTLPQLLPAGVGFDLYATHQDTFGDWSPSAKRSFTASLGPDTPTINAPIGELTVAKPVEFRGTYTNPLNNAFSRVQVEVWNEFRTVRHAASGDQSSTVAVALGGEWVITTAWMANLAFGKPYWGRARTKDALGNYGGWKWFSFYLNAAPRPPFDLTPSGGRLVPGTVLQASLSDPDGDPITQVFFEVRRKSTDAIVGSGNGVIAPNGRTATVDVAGTILSDVAYRYRAYASDGKPPSPSAWSSYAEFTWAPVPDIRLLLPSVLEETINLAEDPSFEYPSTWWSSFAEVAGVNVIERVHDPESWRGEWSLRGLVQNAAASSPIKRSGFKAVDPTRPHYFSARIMRESLSLPASTRFGIEAYNSTGTLLATLYPGTMLNGVDPGSAWRESDGFIGPAALGYTTEWPAGTTQYRIMFEPSRGAPSAVRLDGVYIRRLPANFTAVMAESAKRWLGYFDGDTAGFGGRLTDYTYTTITGQSEQRGLNVLEYPQSNIQFTYTSPGSSLKSNDRLYIDQRNVNGTWRRIYDSGWVGGGRTSVPLPSALFVNGQRYRFWLEARDSAATPRVGGTGWIEFDTMYEGPTPPRILSVTGDPARASVRASWERTAVSPLFFAGYEVAISRLTERIPDQVLAFISNPEITDFEWHEPKAGEEYYLMVRQAETVVGETVQGDWSRARARVDFRQWHLKSLYVPDDVGLGFDLQAQDVVTWDYPALETELWDHGGDRPSYYTEPADQVVGTVIIRLDRGDPELLQREQALKEIRRLRRYGVLLQTTDPSEVYRMHVSTIQEELSDLPWHTTWTLGLKEMAYETDYYLREGVSRVG